MNCECHWQRGCDFDTSLSPSPSPRSFVEIIITDAATGAPLDVPPGAFNLSLWTVHYPYDDGAAAAVSTQSPALDAVWRFCAYTVKATTLDIYAGASEGR